MSIRHLEHLFDPASVAVIGASTQAGSVGATVWRNLRQGGFAGGLWPVNLRNSKVAGERAYARVADLPEVPEMAVVCTPPETVPQIIADLGERGTRAAVVLTAGLAPNQRQAMLDAAKPHVLRILGPNCLGLLSPHLKLNASFAHAGVGSGALAFVSQSGALAAAMLDWARGRGIGLSRVVSLGEGSDIDFGDMLDWLASDARTRAILLYAESFRSARKLMSAARAAARNKPVIVVKSGRTSAGEAAARSHSGALAGSDVVVDAAIRRAGMLRVDTLQELFVAAETLARFRAPPRGSDLDQLARLTLLTNGGGAGVLAADAAAHHRLDLAALPEDVKAALEGALPANWSRGNPVDIIGDAPVERYVSALTSLLQNPETGSVLFIHAPTAIVGSEPIARALVPIAAAHPGRVTGCWLGDQAVVAAQRVFHDAGIPHYDTPEHAVQALAMLATYRRNQEQLLEAPPADAAGPALDLTAVRGIVGNALEFGREMLGEAESKALLAACGIKTVPTTTVPPTPEAAAEAARKVGYPVVLKIVSRQISHKSDVGGVALDLANAREVKSAATRMLARVAKKRPGVPVDGFTVQPMVRRPGAIELIAGTHIDPLFGPVLLFGAGGTSVEVVADRAVALPPLNEPLARELVSRTRVSRLLAGWRDVPPADRNALHGALIALSQLLALEPRIVELDINPLLVDAEGVLALDARVRVSGAAPGGAGRFAIRPYPSELVERLDWKGTKLTLRPIRPEDEARHLAFLERVEPTDIRMRLFYTRRSIERSELARLTQIDYEREMAIVATAVVDGEEQTLGVVRVFVDPDNVEAEYGILIRSDMKGTGLGWLLMNKIIAFLKGRGTQRVTATVLRENDRMLSMAMKLGFVYAKVQPEESTRRIELALR